MYLSGLLGKTLRQPPSDASLASHQWLVRAGYVRAQERGGFCYLPLGRRSLGRLESLARRELAALGAQEVYVPAPGEANPAAALAPAVYRDLDSYRQLPALLFQVATRSLRQPGSHTGLFGACEGPVVEIAAFAGAGLAGAEEQVTEAMARLFRACELPVVWASAGDAPRRALTQHPAGDDPLALCPACGWAAERAWAAPTWPEPSEEPELPPEEIATPDCDTIAALAAFLHIPAWRTMKMVFYSVDGRVTCAVIRGDRSVDPEKLARLLGTRRYYLSTEDELAEIGAVGGYASPIGLDPRRVRIVADPSVRSGRNFVSGANRAGYHIRNVNVPRDFQPGEWVDLALVEAGDPCPRCGNGLRVEAAFALIDSSAAARCRPAADYLDAEGRAQPLWMAGWRLDLARLAAAVVEAHHDEHGIAWPAACAPFDLHLVGLDLRVEEVKAQAEALYERLQAAGLSVLYDDREASAGVKFNDADLIGLPLRLTASKRWLADGAIEAKWRSSPDRLKLDDEALAAELARIRMHKA